MGATYIVTVCLEGVLLVAIRYHLLTNAKSNEASVVLISCLLHLEHVCLTFDVVQKLLRFLKRLVIGRLGAVFRLSGAGIFLLRKLLAFKVDS